jgi:hypothetical protein
VVALEAAWIGGLDPEFHGVLGRCGGATELYVRWNYGSIDE